MFWRTAYIEKLWRTAYIGAKAPSTRNPLPVIALLSKKIRHYAVGGLKGKAHIFFFLKSDMYPLDKKEEVSHM